MDRIELVDPRKLYAAAPFSTLFPISAPIYREILKSMKESGFDGSKPINVWREKNIVVDGNTRRKAAIEAGRPVVVFYHDFKSEDEAFEYAVANQRNRRNLTDADFMRLRRIVDQRKAEGRPRKTTSVEVVSGESAKRTADLIGTSKTKVDKLRAIEDRATPEVKKAVEDGKMSINMAYNKTQEAHQQKQNRNLPPVPRTVPVVPVEAAPEVAIEAAVTTDGDGAREHSLRSRLTLTRKFDDDAKIYAIAAPILAHLRSKINEAVGVRSVSGMTPLHYALHKAMSVQPVEAWTVCGRCRGTASLDGACRHCRGSGYVIPTA